MTLLPPIAAIMLRGNLAERPLPSVYNVLHFYWARDAKRLFFNTDGTLWTEIPLGGQISVSQAVANWVNVSSDLAVQLAANTSYLITNPKAVILQLPTNAQMFDYIEIIGQSQLPWKIIQSDNQQIIFDSISSTIGAKGSLTNTQKFDSIKLLCTQASNIWQVISSIGNFEIL